MVSVLQVAAEEEAETHERVFFVCRWPNHKIVYHPGRYTYDHTGQRHLTEKAQVLQFQRGVLWVDNPEILKFLLRSKAHQRHQIVGPYAPDIADVTGLPIARLQEVELPDPQSIIQEGLKKSAPPPIATQGEEAFPVAPSVVPRHAIDGHLQKEIAKPNTLTVPLVPVTALVPELEPIPSPAPDLAPGTPAVLPEIPVVIAL